MQSNQNQYPSDPFAETHPSQYDEELRLIADSARDFAMILTDPDRNVVRWNSGAEHITGWSEEEVRGKRESDLIFTPEDKAAGVPQQEQDTALREGRAVNDRWHLKKDGSRFWANGVMTPLFDPDTGRLRGFGKILRDETEKKRAQEARSFLAAVVESSRDSVVTVDFDGVITSWNRAAEDLYGYTAREAIGRPLATLTFPDDLREVLDSIDRVRDSRSVATFDSVRVHKSGRQMNLEVVMSPVKDDRGRVIGVSTVARDVTERRKAEEEMRASEAKLRTLFESMDEGYLLAEVLFEEEGDGRGRDILYTEVNPAATKMVGLDLTGLRLSEVDRSYEPYWHEIWAQVARTGVGERLERYAGPLGIWFDFYVFKPGGAEAVAAGDTTQVAVVFRDVTERRKTEKALVGAAGALRQANETLEARVAERTRVLQEQTATLEEQAAVLREQAAVLREQAEEVSRTNEARQALLQRVVTTEEQERRRISRELHDQTGQNLTGLALGLQSLEERIRTHMPPDAPTYDHLHHLRIVAHELAQDIHRIAVELRPTALDDLGLVPALATNVARWSSSSGIPTEFENFALEGSDERLPELLETTIYRVVQEALTNTARHGTNPATRATRVSVTLQRLAGRIQVTVEDDGPGFDVEAAQQSGRLGLAGMAERAGSCGGTLDIESEPGKGTTVILRVPLR